MPGRDSIITTEADSLINLLKIKGEISLEEAAKELRLPVKTVEDYANFFDEEGLININYRFTTPFLSIKKKKDDVPEIAFSLDEKKKEPNAFISNLKNDLELLKLRTKSGKLYFLKTLYPNVLKGLNEFINNLSLEKSPEELQHMKIILKDIEKDYKIADNALANNNTELAKQKFEFLEKQINNFYSDLHQEELMKSVKEKGEKTDSMISKVYDLLEKEDFDSAKELYKTLEEEYNHLPSDYQARMNLLKGELMNINNKFSEKVEAKYAQDMKKGHDLIEKHIRSALHNLEKDKLSDAIKDFNKIKEVYYSLPDGFVNKKIELNQEILNTFDQINKKREEFLHKKFREISMEITKRIDDIKKSLAVRNFNECIILYNEAVAYYNKLPEVNIPIKKNIKNYLLLVYEKLSSAKLEYYNNFLKKEIEKIETLIKETKIELNRDRIINAKKKYDELIKVYKSLPKGYTYELAPTQKRINYLYKLFSERLNEEARMKFNQGIELIKIELNKVQEEVKKEDYEEALKMYEKGMIIFNNLPKGFFKERNELEGELLKTYKSMIKKMDDLVLYDEGQEVRDIYHNFLKNVLLFYMHLEEGNLKLIESDYRHIIDVFEKLPYGLVKRSALIKREISKVNNEMYIIRMMNRIDFEMYNKRIAYAKRAWKQGHSRFNLLKPDEPDVRALYRLFDNKLDSIEKDTSDLRRSIGSVERKIVKEEEKKIPTKKELKIMIDDAFNKKEEIESEIKETTKKEVKPISPLTEREQKTFKHYAKKEKLGKEFEDLRKILETNVIDTLYSKKKKIFIQNRLELANELIKIERFNRARDLIGEILRIEPKNKEALHLIEKIKNGKTH